MARKGKGEEGRKGQTAICQQKLTETGRLFECEGLRQRTEG